ncbi:FHA domain-containing protein [Neorhodopirellula pilleata]|uniref:Oxoglutarate dehydrogenase inhibitor n=1 Tax=Neorhodopirellula pilleata TaxID=2714738 RepID=A0A5C6ADQ8_9BACT|nr:FHA domain-containing protein [Neorhodopirellula pilleata]TWT96383.1 Oxoglutarate dehydrogenase inhibitor [Neorhodopirellula pilleata]
MQIKLRVQSGSHAGKEIEVNQDTFLIGRSDSCQLRPKSESVSRKHCILAIKDGRVLVQDLKSRNGTFVNEKRLPPDKAKVLKDGDILRVGKLSFGLVIEHGLHAAKKPEVTSVADAAVRTAASNSDDSKFEEVDVSSWLDEADAIDRVRKMNDPETRQLTLQDQPSAPGDESDDLSVSESVAGKDGSDPGSSASENAGEEANDKKDRKIPPKKQKPGKLPETFKAAMQDNSRDAADDALKRFFSGR